MSLTRAAGGTARLPLRPRRGEGGGGGARGSCGLPRRGVEIGERHLAGAGVDAVHPRASLGVERALGQGRAVGQRDAVALAGDRLALLVDELDLDPVLLLLGLRRLRIVPGRVLDLALLRRLGLPLATIGLVDRKSTRL